MYPELRCPNHRTHTMGLSDVLECSLDDQCRRSSLGRRPAEHVAKTADSTETCSISLGFDGYMQKVVHAVFFARALHPTDTCRSLYLSESCHGQGIRCSGHVSHAASSTLVRRASGDGSPPASQPRLFWGRARPQKCARGGHASCAALLCLARLPGPPGSPSCLAPKRKGYSNI